jgi:hypothetical protein
VKFQLSELVEAVEASDATTSTASPSLAGTAVSTPTSQLSLDVANGYGTGTILDVDKIAQKMVNDIVDDGSALLPLTTQALPPPSNEMSWLMHGCAPKDVNIALRGSSYRERLRSRGQVAMNGNDMWRHVAVAQSSGLDATSGNVQEDIEIARRFGLLMSSTAGEAFAQSSAAQCLFSMPRNIAPMSSTSPQLPNASMSPKLVPTVTTHGGDMNALLSIAMPTSFVGLSAEQIEEQLRVAASQIDVYDD